jgi:hypothetical protein
MLKRITSIVAGLGFLYATYKFGALAYTLLASGQFFTPPMAVFFAVVCAAIGGFLVEEGFA